MPKPHGPLVECVPNFSEGRDRAKISEIQAAIESVPGVYVLDLHMDPDHHRSVLTLVGAPARATEAAVRAVETAAALIDLNQHRGEHPRIGAADVVPFVPLRASTISDCAELAHRAGREIWRRCGVPVYFYGDAAIRPTITLANLRRGGFEKLRETVLSGPEMRPDIGGPALHPTAGATAVGVRRALIAFNVLLNSGEVEVARKIARAVRTSSGGLPALQALGLLLRSRSYGGVPGQAQVSMNLTDYELTSLMQAFLAVEREATRQGVSVAESELVGLVPVKALEGVQPEELRIANFNLGMILENRLAEVMNRRADKGRPSADHNG